MGERRVEEKELSLEDVFLGSLRHAQVCHGAKSFIAFSGRGWGRFFYFVFQEVLKGDETGVCVPAVEFKWASGRPILNAKDCQSLELAVEMTSIVDRGTHRFRLDTDGDVWGTKLGREFPDLAEKIFFQMTLEGDEFIRFE